MDKQAERRQQDREHMRAVKETRFRQVRGGHPAQVHATATVFVPDSNISREDMDAMDSGSDDETIPADIMADMVAKMKSEKREETLRVLHGETGFYNGKPNPILGVLRRIPPRRYFKEKYKKITNREKRIQRSMDSIYQAEIYRSLEKWRKASAVATTTAKADTGRTEHSPSKQSVPSLHDAKTFNENVKNRNKGGLRRKHPAMRTVNSIPRAHARRYQIAQQETQHANHMQQYRMENDGIGDEGAPAQVLPRSKRAGADDRGEVRGPRTAAPGAAPSSTTTGTSSGPRTWCWTPWTCSPCPWRNS